MMFLTKAFDANSLTEFKNALLICPAVLIGNAYYYALCRRVLIKHVPLFSL